MTTNSCANWNTTNTESRPLKLCGSCKTVAYCNRACQKANWKAHKSSCRHQSDLAETREEAANDKATFHEITNTITTLEATANCEPTADESPLDLDPVEFGLGESFTIPLESCYIRHMPPTPELPRGYHKLIELPEEWLATIAHLSPEEREKAKSDFVEQMDVEMEARMTLEIREEKRLEAAEAGKWQGEFFRRLALKRKRDAERE